MAELRSDVAERYASAFFDLAKEQGQTEALERDMRGVTDALAESDDLRRLVRSPAFDADQKRRGMTAVLDRMGAHGLTKNLIGLLVRNGRLFALPGIARAFTDLAAKDRGEVAAEAVTAHPLSPEQDAELRRQIAQAVGREVNLTTRVDPDLLGGLVVKVGSRMMDSSLRTKLSRLQARLKAA